MKSRTFILLQRFVVHTFKQVIECSAMYYNYVLISIIYVLIVNVYMRYKLDFIYLL